MVRVTQMSGEPVRAYRTRSGRVVRQVPRYEPDENTIFEDEESSGSDFTDNTGDTDDTDDTGDTGDTGDTDVTGDTESLSGSDATLSDVMSLNSSLGQPGDEDLDDVLDWDRLTDDAHTGDESSEEEELYDDDEEDTETL